MKQLLRIVLGFLPLGVGFLQNAYMMARMDTLPPLMLIALGTLLLWGLLSYLTFDGKSRVLSQTLAFSAASLLALALVLVQELLLGHYWPNWAGVASQFFFLPLINLTGILPLHYLWLDDVVISLVLFFISLAICRKKQKVIQANESIRRFYGCSFHTLSVVVGLCGHRPLRRGVFYCGSSMCASRSCIGT